MISHKARLHSVSIMRLLAATEKYFIFFALQFAIAKQYTSSWSCCANIEFDAEEYRITDRSGGWSRVTNAVEATRHSQVARLLRWQMYKIIVLRKYNWFSRLVLFRLLKINFKKLNFIIFIIHYFSVPTTFFGKSYSIIKHRPVAIILIIKADLFCFVIRVHCHWWKLIIAHWSISRCISCGSLFTHNNECFL